MAKLTGQTSSNIEDRRAGTVGGFIELLNHSLYGSTLSLYDDTVPTVLMQGESAFPRPTAKTYELIDRTIKQRYDMRMQQYIRATVPDRVEETWTLDQETGDLIITKQDIWPNQDEPLHQDSWINNLPAQQQQMRVADTQTQRYATQTYTTKAVTRAAPTAAEIDTLTYTLLGEAESGGAVGMTAVANVIRNRADSGIYPENPAEVALQAKAFSTWNSAASGGNMDATKLRNPPGSKNYELAKSIAQSIIYGDRTEDITRGALMYHKTGTTAYWSSEASTPWGTTNIGGNTFYAREPAPKMVQATVAAVSYNAGMGVVNLAPSTGERVVQSQSRVASVRKLDINSDLHSLLSSVGDELDVYFEVTSGGQKQRGPFTKKGVDYIGSTRHDLGASADTKAYTLNPDGSKHYLDMSVPADRAKWERIVQLSVAGGATGIGAAPDYMGNFTMHIGYGDPLTWGAGGKSANAPQWLRDAYAAGGLLPPLNIPGVLTSVDANQPVPLVPPLKMLMAHLPKLPFGATAAMNALAGEIDELGGLNRMNDIILSQRAAAARESMKFPETILGEMTDVAMDVTPVLEWPTVLNDPRPEMDVVFDPSRGAFVDKANEIEDISTGVNVGLDALDMAMAAARGYQPVAVPPSSYVRPEAPAAGMPAAKAPPKVETGGLSPTERDERRAAMTTFAVRPDVPISDNTSNAPPFPEPRPASITTPPGPPAADLPVADLLTDQQKQALREIGSRTIVGGIVREEVARIAGEALGAAAPQVLETIAGVGSLFGSGEFPYPETPNFVRPEAPSGAKRIDDIVSTFRGGGPIAVSSSRPVTVIGKPAATAPTGKPVTKEVRNAIANVPVTSYQTTTVPSVPKGSTTSPTGSTVTTAQRNAIASLSGPTKTPVSKTVYVHKDGSTSTVKPADAAIPREYKPQIVYETKTITIPNPAANKPVQVKAPKPVGPATQTTDPAMRNAITNVGTSAPGKGLTAAQRTAMTSLAGTGVKNPVPPVPVVPIPRTIQKTIKVKKTIMVPVPTTQSATPKTETKTVTVYNPGTNTVERSTPGTFKGTSTGRTYNVGQVYQTGVYIYRAEADGSFTRIGTVGGVSSAQAYANANAGPGSVAAMELKHSGQSRNPQSGGPASGGEYASGGR